jgi:transglutaminase-like putative cysteine protease
VTTNARLPETRLLLVLQIVCAASSVASLPRGQIHPFWLLTFIIPAALFLFLGTGNRKRLLPTWARVTIAVVFQVLAAYTTYYFSTYYFHHPLDEKSSLACSLLPALTYFTLRREPSDTSLSLFLSFCFLLIGIMLNHDAADWTLIVFLCSCAWAMQIEASNRALTMRHAARGVSMSFTSKILRRTQVVAALMLVAFLLYQGIDLLPSPGRPGARSQGAPPASHGGRIMGLNSRFDLSGGEGSPLNLTADRVLLVEDPSGDRVPSDLYLRMTYFDRAFSDEWQTWAPNWQKNDTSPEKFDVREPIEPLTRYPRARLQVKRLEPTANGEMFLPPGTEQIFGIRRMVFEKNVGFFRSLDPRETGYGVLYQRPHKLRRLTNSIDPFHDRINFRELPPDLRTDKLKTLARQLGGPDAKNRSPMGLARKIAKGLQDRCSYVLRAPSGPYPDAIHNFLFGNRKGYCMHFATSLAIMLRIHDVPCRIAVGFHAGESIDDGKRVFGSQHAHAWVEIPLGPAIPLPGDGVDLRTKPGWTLLDPTPPADRTRRGWPNPGTLDQPTPEAADSGGEMFGSSCFLASLSDPLANPGALMLATFVLVCLTIGFLVLVARRSHRPTRRAFERPTHDSIRARRVLDQILAALAQYGQPKHQRATLEQYARALRGDKDLNVPILAQAFRAYQDVRFGAKHLDDEREGQLSAGLVNAKEAGA